MIYLRDAFAKLLPRTLEPGLEEIVVIPGKQLPQDPVQHLFPHKRQRRLPHKPLVHPDDEILKAADQQKDPVQDPIHCILFPDPAEPALEPDSESVSELDSEPVPEPASEPDSEPQSAPKKRVARSQYHAIETHGCFGLLDTGFVDPYGFVVVTVHVPRYVRGYVLNLAEGDEIHANNCFDATRSAVLHVGYVTPREYVAPGRKVTMCNIGIPAHEWRALMQSPQ